jgi:proteic killer suppression protein
MIKTFACPETEKIARGRRSHTLPSNIQNVARRKLRYLQNAKTLHDLRMPPANRLEALQGDRRGQYSMRINDQWRLCFAWRNGDAYGVEIVDYH